MPTLDPSSDDRIAPTTGCRVSVADVRLVLGGRCVLDGLSLMTDCARVGIVGRNGSGKSTLARLIAGLVAPREGTVRVNGIDPARDRRAALAEVGILFQNPDHQIIFPTVIEELCFGLTQIGLSPAQARTRATAILSRFGVGHWLEAAVATLSQGQKQLLCLMAIVAMEPRLLILDEPFAGLDIPTRAQLRRALDRYEGALWHITHDPADVAQYQQILWIDRGKVRASGPADTVLPAYVAEMTRTGAGDDLADL